MGCCGTSEKNNESESEKESKDKLCPCGSGKEYKDCCGQ